MKTKCVAVVGPTACGKSDLAVKLAEKFGGEVISADSRQIFKGMDLGTGKVSGFLDSSFSIDCPPVIFPFVSSGIRHWMIDILDPIEKFSAADFQRCALALIKNISERNRSVFVAGGTGFFVRSLTDGLDFAKVQISEEVRRYVLSLSLSEASERLISLQSDAESFVDLKNPRRVARALELMLSGLGNLSAMKNKRELGLEFLVLGLSLPRETLKLRIFNRLEERLQKGMVAEIEGLIERGVPISRLESFGLEYRMIARYVSGSISYDEMKTSLYSEICKFAKRQMTWFKKYSNVVWLDGEREAFELVEHFLTSMGETM